MVGGGDSIVGTSTKFEEVCGAGATFDTTVATLEVPTGIEGIVGRLRRLGGMELEEMRLASFSASFAALGLRLFLIQFCRYEHVKQINVQ